jgi:hypothetical protein
MFVCRRWSNESSRVRVATDMLKRCWLLYVRAWNSETAWHAVQFCETWLL